MVKHLYIHIHFSLLTINIMLPTIHVFLVIQQENKVTKLNKEQVTSYEKQVMLENRHGKHNELERKQI